MLRHGLRIDRVGRHHGDCGGGRSLTLWKRRLDRWRGGLLRTGPHAADSGGNARGRRSRTPGLLGCGRGCRRRAGSRIRLGDRGHRARGRGSRGGRNLLGGRRGGGRRALTGRRSGRCSLLPRSPCRPCRALGRSSVRRRRAALLTGGGLARALLLTGRPALLVLRLGGLCQAPAIIQCGGRASAIGRRDDGQHRCGNQKRCSCHAVSSSPGWIGPRPLLIRRICAKRRNAPQQCQQHDKTTAIGRPARAMVKLAPGEPSARKVPRSHVGSVAGPPDGRKTAAAPLRPAAQTCRSTSSLLMSAIALAGLRPLGQALAQFMMVWQRYRRNGSSRSSSRAPVASSRLSLIQR
jgi:hypothetical protein